MSIECTGSTPLLGKWCTIASNGTNVLFSLSPLARRVDQPPSRPGCNLLLAVLFFFFCLRLFCLPFKEKGLPSCSQREQQFSVSVTSTVKSKPGTQAGGLLALSSKYCYSLPSSLVILGGGEEIYKERRKPASHSRERTKSRSGRDLKLSATPMCSVGYRVNGSASPYAGTPQNAP